MILESTRDGLRRAWRLKRLAVLLWLANLLLALIVAVPFALALASATQELPLADEAAAELRVGVLADLLELRPGLLGPFFAAAACALALGWVLSAALTGGTLEVLLQPGERPLLHRFGHGAGRYFGRFLRLGALASTLALALAGLAGATVHFIAGKPEDSAWEPARMVWNLGTLAAAGLVALPGLLALDAARIAVARDDSRGMLRALRAGLATVRHHPARWIGQWMLFNLFAGLVLALLLLLRLPLAGRGGFALALLFLAHQAFIFIHAWLRVARYGAQASLLGRLAASARR